MEKAFKIKGAVKNYEWGKIGASSVVAKLMTAASTDFVIDNIPYAELWMGTHTSGQAHIPHLKDLNLMDWIQSNPECLGENITNLFGASNGLPFLFKVLSVNKALSIQVHPDKKAAEKLNKEFPEHYPDDNHKPEMAIALTEFKALCGFRPLQEIKEFFSVVPPLKKLVGEDVLKKFVESQSASDLKSLFTILMTCPKETYQTQFQEVLKIFREGSFKSNLCNSIRELFLKTASQYPNDIGCFCLFFLNYLNLKPGDAIFLAANEPHAYLAGDCVECMACSDNVVRAGLTPKFKDVETLCNMLTYKCKTGEENLFPFAKDPLDPYIKIYTPPVKEFAIDVIALLTSCQSYFLRSITSASIVLVVQGKGSYRCEETENSMSPGDIIFSVSESVLSVTPETDMLLFRAFCNA